MPSKVGMDVERIQREFAYKTAFSPGILCPKCKNGETRFTTMVGGPLEFYCLDCRWSRKFENWREKEQVVILPRTVCSDCGADTFVNSNTKSWECVYCQ